MTTFHYEFAFFWALLLTVVVETVTVFVVLKGLFKNDVRFLRVLFAGSLPSFATLPYLWFILPVFFIGHHSLYVFVGELSVTLAEIVILRGILSVRWREAAILSIAANAASYSIGRLV